MKPASTVDMDAPDHKLVRQHRGQTLAADPSVSQREAAIDNCRKDSELANSDMSPRRNQAFEAPKAGNMYLFCYVKAAISPST
ncbi:hypothetical protein PSTG_16849 [Puccinia striiformis f. sp. tritici PST-78]|uniref:Uncharacterized protein n=1 Tax=Puccinia striiformis f. sp. tritici PST-78 TaxID=1165861 RepID=A0A0L0US04_9BASI|nr:hypothetical protein PSTG_16849 [Puccinia striiformis f. sp. tritici PST-78]